LQYRECRYKKENDAGIIIKDIMKVAQDENALKEAIATVGPVSIAYKATNKFRFYKGGSFIFIH
jgi:hypothetical protein